MVALYTLELVMLEWGVRKNFPIALVTLGSRAGDLCFVTLLTCGVGTKLKRFFLAAE